MYPFIPMVASKFHSWTKKWASEALDNLFVRTLGGLASYIFATLWSQRSLWFDLFANHSFFLGHESWVENLPFGHAQLVGFIIISGFAFGVAMTLDIVPRLSALGVFFCMKSLVWLNPNIFDTGTQVLLALAVLSIFLPHNANSESGRARFLVQMQMSCIYLGTAVEKMASIPWSNGSAMILATNLQQFRSTLGESLSITGPWLGRASGLGVIVMELTAGWMLLSRRWKYWAVSILALMHVTFLFYFALSIFQYVMLVGLLSFVDSQDSRLWYQRCRKAFKGLRRVSAMPGSHAHN